MSRRGLWKDSVHLHSVFDATDLLGRSAEAIWTYSHQTEFHGLPISSAGLARDMAPIVLAHAIQGHLLQLLEDGKSALDTLLLWTKGSAKCQYILSLIQNVALPVPVFVRNLEEVGCPSARRLCEDATATSVKAGVLAEWLIANHLDDHAGLLHSVN